MTGALVETRRSVHRWLHSQGSAAFTHQRTRARLSLSAAPLAHGAGGSARLIEAGERAISPPAIRELITDARVRTSRPQRAARALTAQHARVLPRGGTPFRLRGDDDGRRRHLQSFSRSAGGKNEGEKRCTDGHACWTRELRTVGHALKPLVRQRTGSNADSVKTRQ